MTTLESMRPVYKGPSSALLAEFKGRRFYITTLHNNAENMNYSEHAIIDTFTKVLGDNVSLYITDRWDSTCIDGNYEDFRNFQNDKLGIEK